MTVRNEILIPLLVRATVAAAPLLLGRHLLSLAARSGSIGELLGGISLAVLPALIVAPPIARIFGNYAGGIYFPGSDDHPPPPAYGRARALRMQGLHLEALEEYRKQLALHPHEFDAYLEMLTIALDELADRALASRIVAEAVSAIDNRAQIATLRRRLAEAPETHS